MNPKITSSFIPDKNNTRPRAGRVPEGGLGDMVLLLGIVVLVVSIALAIGVFLYDRFITASVASKSEQLTRAREQFDPILIQNLVRLDARINAASQILAQHLAPSEVFRLLEEITLQSISYDSLSYTMGEDGAIHIDMAGVAQSVNGVALQSSLFGEHNAIVNPIFSDLDLTDKGVEFRVTASVDPVAIQYLRIAQERPYTPPLQLPLDGVLPVDGTDPFMNDTNNDTTMPATPSQATPPQNDFESL